MADGFTTIILGMINNPPDPSEPIPLANHKETMFGVTITFHFLSWIFVIFRLYTRLRIVREPGWDDLFVFLAAVVNLASVVGFLEGARYGFGQHLIYVFPTLKQIMVRLYITNAAYHTTTALIKISLLLQYLRLFREGTRRTICIILLSLVTIWGLAFSFMAWLPCFPVSGFWDRTMTPPAKCYGFGFGTLDEAKAVLLGFASTNMFLDIAIFLVPLTEYLRSDLRRKQVLAMTGLFSMGLIVVLMAVLRLWSTFKHSQGATDSFDFTWWYPEVLIISCLEVDFAIMSASMPIFWPTVVATWSQISVTKEVHVTHHPRLHGNSADHFEMNRPNSLKSTASTEGLTRVPTHDQKSIYMDFDSDLRKGGDLAVRTVEIQSYAQNTRML